MKKSSTYQKICRISAIWLILISLGLYSCAPSAVRTGSKVNKKIVATKHQKKEVSPEEKIKEFEQNIAKQNNLSEPQPKKILPSLEEQLAQLSNEQVVMKNQISNLQKDVEDIRYTLDEIKNSLHKSNIIEKKSAVPGEPIKEQVSNNTQVSPNASNVLLSDEEAAKTSYIRQTKKVQTQTKSITNTNENKTVKSSIKTTTIQSNRKVEAKPTQKDSSNDEITSKSELTQALALFNQRQYGKVIDELSNLVSSTKNEAIKNEARYLLAESHMQLGNYEQAAEYFSELSGEKAGERAPEIALKLAECKIKLGRIAEARNTYREIIEKYPRSEYVPKARKMLQQM